MDTRVIRGYRSRSDYRAFGFSFFLFERVFHWSIRSDADPSGSFSGFLSEFNTTEECFTSQLFRFTEPTREFFRSVPSSFASNEIQEPLTNVAVFVDFDLSSFTYRISVWFFLFFFLHFFRNERRGIFFF